MAWWNPFKKKTPKIPTSGEGSMVFKESEKSSAQKAIDAGSNVTVVSNTGTTTSYSGGTQTGTGRVGSSGKITRPSSSSNVPEQTLQGELDKQTQSPIVNNKNQISPLVDRTKKTVSSVSYGIPIVKKDEAERSGPTSTATWTLQSTSLDEIPLEMSFLSSTPQTAKPFSGTKESFIYDTANINYNQNALKDYKQKSKEFLERPESFEGQKGINVYETEDGKRYEATPEFFDMSENYKSDMLKATKDARATYKDFSTSEKFKMGGKSIGIGVMEISEGFSGYYRKLVFEGMGGGQLGSSGKLRTTEYFDKQRDTGRVDFFSRAPTPVKSSFLSSPIEWTKESFSSPRFTTKVIFNAGAVTAGVIGLTKNINQFGFKGGIAETLSGVLPAKIKTHIYSPSLDTSYEGVSFKTGNNKRFFFGESGDIKLGGFEKTTKGITTGFVTTESPAVSVSGGGTNIQYGTRTTIQFYNSKSIGTGQPYVVNPQTGIGIGTPSFRGGVSNVASGGATQYTFGDKIVSVGTNKLVLDLSRSGGFTGPTKATGITQFTTGDVTATGKPTGIDKLGLTSSKYKLGGSTFEGIEINLKQFIGGLGIGNPPTGSSFSGGGKSSGFSSGGTTGGQVQQVSQVSVTRPITLPKLFSPPPAVTTATSLPIVLQTSQDQQSLMNQKQIQESSQILFLPSKVKTDIKTDQQIFTDVNSNIFTDILPKTRSRGKVAIATPDLFSDTVTDTKTFTDTVTRNPPIPRYTPITPGKPIVRNTPDIYKPTVPIPFKLPFVFGMDFGGSLKGMKVKRKYSYTPSFGALVFKIKGVGKAPKATKRFTGLEVRPIYASPKKKGKGLFNFNKIKI